MGKIKTNQMKFTTIAALVGVASAIEVEQINDDTLMQESA